MVNHGLSTGALFMVLGFLINRGRSRLIADYSGIAKVAPILAALFFISGLSSLALPGLSTFISEFLVLLGTFTRYTTAAVHRDDRHRAGGALHPAGLPAHDAGRAVRGAHRR